MIKVAQLSKRFGETTALADVSFRVARGEIVGFLGLNGAGKTTTMRILASYLTADTGSVHIGGIDVQRHPLEARRNVGYLPEHPPLYHDDTVDEFLRFCAALRGDCPH